MADFCAQCAAHLGFDRTDFPKRDAPPPGHGYMEICEGCGPAVVDGDGRCLGGCIRPEHADALEQGDG